MLWFQFFLFRFLFFFKKEKNGKREDVQAVLKMRKLKENRETLLKSMGCGRLNGMILVVLTLI